jgi:hypothetical protein
VIVVAIAELTGPPEGLPELARELGTTLYELKLTLSTGFPAVVLATTEPPRAALAMAAIERSGYRAVMCDRAEMVPSTSMTALRDFLLGPAGIAPTAGPCEQLPYADLLALLRASHRTTTTSTEEVKERKLRPGMAIATGGLVLSKKTTREVTTKTESREQVLYFFRKSGAPPWILRERSARYMGLGSELRPTSLENFATTVRLVRRLAPKAHYDERLMSGRPIRGVAEGIDAADVLAYLVANDLTAAHARF